LVADADPLVRMALVDKLACEGDVEVVATAVDGATTIAAIKRHAVDVVLLSACLGPQDGLATMRRIHATEPRIAVLILSTTGDHALGLRALNERAAGFLGKDFSLEALGRIVRCLAGGEIVISRGLTTKLVGQLNGRPEAGRGLRPVRSSLSTREWEVLDLICGGASTEIIAGELRVSAATIRSHVSSILRKLGVRTRSEAAARARELLRPR
jgi:NarL family two-component system response regulator LiaR